MRAQQISVAEARAYFQHKSQQRGFTAGEIPDDIPAEFWACGPVCGVFHYGNWPDVYQAHYGVKPEGWGKLTEPSKAVLGAFWDAHKAKRIIGWTDSRNRAALAFNRRIGFTIDGRMQMPDHEIIMQGWKKWE